MENIIVSKRIQDPPVEPSKNDCRWFAYHEADPVVGERIVNLAADALYVERLAVVTSPGFDVL
jgi:hypothetical protein